jgi:hypothetical protein
VLPLLAGCIVVSARLAPDGSGTMTMRYRVAYDATEFLEKRRFTSPHVRVESVKITESLDTVVTLAFDDVARLPTAPAFRDVRVVREREGDGERLTVIVPRVTAIAPAGATPRRPGAPGPQITWYLPGRVRTANRDAVVSGDRVTWSFSLDDYLAEPSIDLSVRYDTAAADTR